MFKMKPIVNINGTSRDYLIHSRQEVYTKISEVLNEMEKMNPHPRDYPGKDDQYRIDRYIHNERILVLSRLKDDIMNEAVDIMEG